MSSLSPLADIEDRVDGVSYHHDTDAENEFMQTAPTLSPLMMKHKLTNVRIEFVVASDCVDYTECCI
jgi:hypothetical protein